MTLEEALHLPSKRLWRLYYSLLNVTSIATHEQAPKVVLVELVDADQPGALQYKEAETGRFKVIPWHRLAWAYTEEVKDNVGH